MANTRRTCLVVVSKAVPDPTLPLLAALDPPLLLVLALQAARAIRTGIEDRPAMTRAIEMTLGIHTIGSIWLTGCALFIAFFSA